MAFVLSRAQGWLPLLATACVLTACAPNLHEAVGLHDAQAVKRALAKGANPNERVDGMTPLCDAIGGGDDDVVAALLAAGASPNAECVPAPGWPATVPLVLAASKHRAKAFRMLIDANAELVKLSGNYGVLREMATDEGDTPHIATLYLQAVASKYGAAKALEVARGDGIHLAPLCSAASEGDVPLAEQLLERGMDPNQMCSASGHGPMDDRYPPVFTTYFGSGSRAHLAAVRELLLKSGANPDPKSEKGRTIAEAAKIDMDRFHEQQAKDRELRAQRAREKDAELRERDAQQRAQWQFIENATSPPAPAYTVPSSGLVLKEGETAPAATTASGDPNKRDSWAEVRAAQEANRARIDRDTADRAARERACGAGGCAPSNTSSGAVRQ